MKSAKSINLLCFVEIAYSIKDPLELEQHNVSN